MNSLDQAKVNLKSVLERLEKAIDRSINDNKKSKTNPNHSAEQMVEELKALRQSIKDKDEEISYLRESNHQLQAQLGKIQDTNRILEEKNSEAVKKFDSVILEVRSFINSQEVA